MNAIPYLDARKVSKSGFYPIYVVVRWDNKTVRLKTGFRVPKEMWDGKAVKKNHPQATLINSKISDMIADLNRAAVDATMRGIPFRPDLAATGHTSYSFIDYIKHRANQYEKGDSPVMALKCARMAKELKMFFDDVRFSDIHPDFVRQLDNKLVHIGNVANTRHKKIKFYSMMLEAAIKDGKHTGINHFSDYKIKTTESHKEKLTREEIDAIAALDLAGVTDTSRDIFLFSFYCKGQRVSDCLLLKRDAIKDGRVNFITEKSGKRVSVKIHERLKSIIDKYIDGDTPYLFPFLKKEVADKWQKIHAVSSQNVIINRELKTIASLAGIDKKVSMHIARHSFASQLMEVTDSIHVIKEALAHSSYNTTERYLKALGDQVVDKEIDKMFVRRKTPKK